MVAECKPEELCLSLHDMTHRNKTAGQLQESMRHTLPVQAAIICTLSICSTARLVTALSVGLNATSFPPLAVARPGSL